MGEMTWRVGDRVRHSAMPQWGLGEILAVFVDGKVRILFENGDTRLFKDPPLTRAIGPDMTRPMPRPPAQTGGRSRGRPAHRSIEAYKRVFTELFPNGFSDSGYIKKERKYKIHAAELMAASLSAASLQSLVAEGVWDEVVKRSLAVISKTNLVFPHEAMALRDGLRTAAARERFAKTLLELLHGGSVFADRFEGFCSLLTDIGAAKWPVATYFPFLANPSAQMFLKPSPTRRVAAACDVELNYRSVPNALTYACLMNLSARLQDILRDLGPSDMIDIQSFIWCVAR